MAQPQSGAPYLPLKRAPEKGEVDSICPGLDPGQMLSGGGQLQRALLAIIAAIGGPPPGAPRRRRGRRPPPFRGYSIHTPQISKTSLQSSTYMLCSDLYGREDVAYRRSNFAISGTTHWKDSGRCVHQTALSGGGIPTKGEKSSRVCRSADHISPERALVFPCIASAHPGDRGKVDGLGPGKSSELRPVSQ